MKPKFNKRGRLNNSKSNLSPRLLKTLKSLYSNEGGTITYVFVEERIDFSDPKYPKGKPVRKKSNITSSINPHVLFDEFRGKLVKRTPQEVLKVFEDTRDDLGASYFIIIKKH